jgi:hypothetical protein
MNCWEAWTTALSVQHYGIICELGQQSLHWCLSRPATRRHPYTQESLLIMMCYMPTCPQTKQVRTLAILTDGFMIFLAPSTGTMPAFAEYFCNTSRMLHTQLRCSVPECKQSSEVIHTFHMVHPHRTLCAWDGELPASSRFDQRTIMTAVISPMPLQKCRTNSNNYIMIYTTTHCNSSTDWLKISIFIINILNTICSPFCFSNHMFRKPIVTFTHTV